MNEPAYIAAIAQLWRSGAIPRGQVVHVDVVHDDWCPLLAGNGACTCKPLVTVRRDAA